MPWRRPTKPSFRASSPVRPKSVNPFVRFDTPGFHSVTATIPPDRLAIDNQRSTAIQAVDRMGVLIVEGSGDAPVSERDGYFLANALAPVSRTAPGNIT